MARFLEAWYQFIQEEQDSLVAKLNEAHEKVGAKRPILMQLKLVLRSMVDCWSRGVPQHRGVQKFRRGLQELNWFRYCESTNVLGTKLES